MTRLLAALLVLLAAQGAEAAYQMTPYTIGWIFPSAGTYPAGIADNGLALSAYNTAAGLTITLPPNPTILPPGWHICAVNDNGKTANFQVNATNGGHILYPNTSVTSLALAPGNYEIACLMADSSGGNFRVVTISPATATAIGMAGAGNVTGPGSSTDGYVVRWSGTSGKVLATGTPVGNLGQNTIMETDSGGHLDPSTWLYNSSGSGGQPLCVTGTTTFYKGSGGSC